MSLTVAYPCRKSKGHEFKKHIKDTSGLKDIEILEYENPENESLTKIYNRALGDASNDVVVLMHDDIFFNKENKNKWGKKLLKHFDETDYGILGVAGTTDLPASGKWWEDPSKMVGVVKHSHTNEDGKTQTWESKYSNNFGNRVIEVAILDGLFLAVHRKRIEKYFDESIEGRHFYDIDFTFNNHLEGVKVGVVFDVKITHRSIGGTDDQWENNRKQFVEKYSTYSDNTPLLPYHLETELIYEDKEIQLSDKEQPKVTMVIPTANYDMVKNLLDSIENKTNYKNLNILIANTSIDNEFDENDLDHDLNIKVVERTYDSFAKINNEMVREDVDEDTELLLFCNDDIQLINDAISRVIRTYNKNKKTCGTVGARLHFGDGKVQHAGITLMLSGDGNLHLSHYGINSYYNFRDSVTKDILGNTGAFMLVSKKLFDEIGGFDENYEVAFEDTQFNIDCIKRGRQNIFDGTAVAYHFETQTRERDENEAEDYRKRIIPYIIKTPEAWGYFLNIKKKEFEALVMQSIQQQQQQKQEQEQ